MKAKSLIINRRDILRNDYRNRNNKLIESLISQKLSPQEINTERSDLEILQSKIEELDWVIEGK